MTTDHPEPNEYHVMCSKDVGEVCAHAWLPKRLADKLAALLQEIEDDRRMRAPTKALRNDPAAFNSYYVVHKPKVVKRGTKT